MPALKLTPVSGDPFAEDAPPAVRLTPVKGDPFHVPTFSDRLSNAAHGVADFFTNSPAQQIIDKNRAAARPQPDAFGSVAATVPTTEGEHDLVFGAPLTLSDVVAGRDRSSARGSFVRHAGRAALPSVGGAAGFGAGFAAGGTLTAPAEAIPVAGPFINLLGALLGGFAGAAGTGYAVDQAQEKTLSLLPDDVVRTLGQDRAQRAIDEAQHPIASFSGSLAPAILTMRPGFTSSPVAADAPLLTRALAHPAGGAAVGATLGGGNEIAHELAGGDGFSPEKIAIATGVGATLNRPTRLGSALFQAGGNAAVAGMQRAARGAGRFAGNENPEARQGFDAEATAQDVTPNGGLPLPSPEMPSRYEPETTPSPRPAPRLVPVEGDPFAPTPAAGAPALPGAVDPQLVANPEPAAAGGDGLGQVEPADPYAGPGGRFQIPDTPAPNDPSTLRPEPGELGEGERMVRTPAGASIRTRMEVVDASELAQAEGANQNRDRSRDTTALQVQDIISKFDPELLHEDPASDRGAPIVGADGAIDSGNGRVLTLNQIYDQHPELAAKYRAMIEARGLSTEGKERPILIQRRMTDMTPEQRRQFVIDSNKDSKLAMTAVETARSDADSITPEMLSRYAGGDINSSANTGFVEAFAKRLTTGEMGNFIGTDRRLTAAGLERIENAVVASAYGNPKLLERMMESTQDDIKAITSSLADVAPAWAKMRQSAKAGEIDAQYDITAALADAAARVSEARKRGTRPADILSQTDAFDEMSPVTAELVRAFYNTGMTRPASKKAVTDFLRDYIDGAAKAEKTEGLFGAEPAAPPLAILKAALARRDHPSLALDDRAPTKEKTDAAARTPSRDESSNDRGPRPDASQGPEAPTGSDAEAADRGAADTGTDRHGQHRRLKAAKASLDALDDATEAPPYGIARAPSAKAKGGYADTFEAASFTSRASIFNSAAETLGLDPDKFTLLPAPRQVALLKQAIATKFGIAVDVDKGMQERFAIDQMLDAFQNVQGMAHVLDLPNKAMGLDGRLSLRLQKTGKFLGRFQSGTNVITLPQRSNSFAHEWGHALDWHLLGAAGEDGHGLSGAIRQRGAKVDDGELPTNVREAFVDLLNAMFFDKADAAAKVLQLEAQLAATNGAKAKEALQQSIDRLRDGSSQRRDIRSAFYKGAKSFDGEENDYWTSPTEMLARSFEAYTSYKVEAAGLTTEFIGKGDANYLDGAGDRFEKTFPKGSERALIFAAYEHLFGQIADAQGLADGPGADKPGGSIRRMTDYDRTPKVAKERGIIQREMTAIRNSIRQAQKEKAGRPDDPKGTLEKVADLNGAVLMSMTGNLRMIQARSGSAALQRLTDLLTKQDGRGDRTVARTFHEDVHLQSKAAVNRLGNILKANGAEHLDAEDTKLLRDLLVGARDDAPPGMGHIIKAAAAIRHLLDNEFYVNQKAGIDLGYTRNGYLARVLDIPKVYADQAGFVTAATEVYELAFDKEYGDPAALLDNEELLPTFMKLAGYLASRGFDLPSLRAVRAGLKAIAAGEDVDIDDDFAALHAEVRPAYAKERAEAWLSKINLVAGQEHNAASPDSKYTKKRELPPEADKIMEQFYLTDPVESVTNYLVTSARRTAYARRFGADGKGRVTLFERMAKEGVTADDQRTVERILDTATGRMRSALPQSVQDGAAFVNAAGTMALLPRAMISSLAEPFVTGLVTGDARGGFKMLGMIIGGALGSPSGKVRFELARAIGLVSDAGSDGIMEARYGQTFADATRWDRYTSTMFRRTGLTRLTCAQVTANVGMGHAFLDNLALKIAGPKGPARDGALALYRELGISDPEAFAAELIDGGRMPSLEELETPFGEDYRTAQLRYSRMTVQQPDAMDRPELAQNPVGRVIYGITGFSYSFWRNIIKRNGILLGEMGRREGAGKAALYGTGLLASAAVAYLLGTTISTIRERLLNPRRWEQLEKKGTLHTQMAQLGFTRTFSFGAADTVIQTWSGLKYQRDLSNVFIGPGPGFFVQNTQKMVKPLVSNSRQTNSAEYNAVQGAYSSASPFLAFGLARIPGGPITDVATGLGMAYVTSANARDLVATSVVGPKDSGKTKTKTAYDQMLDEQFGEVKRKPRADAL